MNKLNKILVITISMLIATPLSAKESLLTSVDSAMRKHRNNQAFLVDIRPETAYNRLHIPGSLNIPLFAVKTTPFLKTKPVILINEGFAVTHLKDECRSLKKKGFNAKVLLGGLNAWHQKKGPLEGDFFAVKTFRTVTPTDLHSQLQNNPLIIDISPKRSQLSKNLLPNAVAIPRKQKNMSLRALRDSVRDIKNKMPSSASILFTNQDGKGYDHIQKQLESADLGPMFYLEGGINGYSRYLERLALSRRPLEERTKTISGCKPCKEKEEDTIENN